MPEECSGYLARHELACYLKDATRLALHSPATPPAHRMREYFRDVLALEHVVGREYAFTSATAWNKRAFIIKFQEAIVHLSATELTVGDFHQLLLLVCPDFPRGVLDAVMHLLPRALVCEGRIRCAALATAFQVHWCHASFLHQLEPYFRNNSLLTSPDGQLPSERVPSNNNNSTSSPMATTALTLSDLSAVVRHMRARLPARPDVIAWPLVQRALGAAGLDKAVSYRKLCQCLLQCEPLAQRLRARPHAHRCATRVNAAMAALGDATAAAAAATAASSKKPARPSARGGFTGDDADAATDSCEPATGAAPRVAFASASVGKSAATSKAAAARSKSGRKKAIGAAGKLFDS